MNISCNYRQKLSSYDLMKNIDGKILSSWLTRQTVLKKKKKLHNPVRCKLKEGRKKYFIRERERDHDGKKYLALGHEE